LDKAECIKPYKDDGRAKGEQVRDMFDSIAPAYDFMNRAMTMGIDRIWRRRAVDRVAARCPADIVDVASGTGDLAIAMARRLPSARILGIDLSEGMLEIGRRKAAEAVPDAAVSFMTGDCLDLPLADASADVVTVAYGVRNFADIAGGYREMLRVLRPGGMLAVLELSVPTSPLVRPLYNFYTKRIIPAAGRVVSHDTSAYSYLPESIAAVAQGREMLALMEEAGFADCAFRSFTFGTCTLYTAFRPLS